jgi:hypothetical protein
LLERIQQSTSLQVQGHTATAEGSVHQRQVSHKFVVLFSIGSTTERPGVQFGSQCLLDPTKDLLATARYVNSSLYGLATIFDVQCEQ